MKVFACTDFKGWWPVPTAAVIIAEDIQEAQTMLVHRLAAEGLPQPLPLTLEDIDQQNSGVVILSDGDY